LDLFFDRITGLTGFIEEEKTEAWESGKERDERDKKDIKQIRFFAASQEGSATPSGFCHQSVFLIL
jgi:hypothetical protein